MLVAYTRDIVIGKKRKLAEASDAVVFSKELYKGSSSEILQVPRVIPSLHPVQKKLSPMLSTPGRTIVINVIPSRIFSVLMKIDCRQFRRN